MSVVRSMSLPLRALAAMAALATLSAVPAAMAATADAPAGPQPGRHADRQNSAQDGASRAAPQVPKNCIQRLRGCGYPSASNTGVKDASLLKPSGSIYATKDGQVIENLDIHGDINVTAANVADPQRAASPTTTATG